MDRKSGDQVTVGSVVPRPPLSKKLFPVSRVGKNKASREVGIFFFFLFLIFHRLECTKKIDKKKLFTKIMEKQVLVGPF